MKSTLIRVLAVMTAVMLLLTGCNLIAIDEEMQAAEDAAAREKDYATKIVEFNDGTYITKGDMINVYTDSYSYYSYLYLMNYGQIPEELADYTKQETATAYVAQEVIKKHAADYGVELTAEMEAQAAESAQAEWDEYITSYMEENPSNAADEETARAEAEAAVAELGYTYEYMLKEHTDSVLVTAITEKMTADVTEPSEEDIIELYNQKVEEDEETYSADTEAYETALLYGTPVFWAPEGYRGVQHILLKPEDEALLTEYTEAYDALMALQQEHLAIINNGVTDEERTNEVVTAEVNAANAAMRAVEEKIIAAVQPTLDEINAKLAEGTAFPDLINEYTADSDTVLYVGPNTTSLIGPFQVGAMALANVGDVSEPIVGQYGVHLIYYASDVQPGAADLETVRETLTLQALENTKAAIYQELVDQWSIDAGTKIYIERWSDEY